MPYNDNFFFLSENKALVSGAKKTVLLDLKEGKTYLINNSAKNILMLGEQGLRIAEAINKLSGEVQSEDVLSFLENLRDRDLIIYSATAKLREPEKRPEPKLDFLWIEITPSCNIRCIHCYAEAGEKEQSPGLSADMIEGIIDDAAALGCRQLQLTGGEPTLRPDIKQLLEHAKAKGFEYIEVFTNGTLLTESMIQFFANVGIHVALSIYSYRSETHDSITRVPGSFKKTLNSLKLLLAYGVPTRCSVIAMKQNEADLNETSYFLNRLGVFDRAPDPIRPSGRGKNLENYPEKYGNRYKQTAPYFWVDSWTYSRNKYWNSCWFGKAAVTGEGDVLPCVFAREQVVGNVKEENLTRIVSGEKMLKIWRLTKDQVEGCKDCEYRYVCQDCRPLAYGINKNVYEKSPRCTYNPYTGEWISVDEALPADQGCADSQKNKTNPST
jgi:radical SAM protein with 4Fe4S-binding SPASM domain